jgi:cytochrome c biogenesis protein CcmG, thiol:disulfide interchange protein DsbE
MNRKSITLGMILLLGVAVVFLIARPGDHRAERKVAAGGKAPGFELKDTDGKVWKLSDLRGRVVVLNFWATWCDPCREEIPSIQNMVNGEKGNEKFVFLSVLYRDDPGKAVAYLRQRGFGFPVLVDDGSVAVSYGVTGVPETFVITPEGVVKDKIVGPIDWNAPEVRAALTKLINAGKS